MAHYEVIVGNIGLVHSGEFIATALAKYAVYVGKSQRNEGRAAGESVYLMKDGEPIQEYQGPADDETEE